MQRFPIAYSSGDDIQMLTANCLEQLGPLPRQANMGFLYATSPLGPRLGEIQTMFKKATGIGHWIGSVGVGITCTGLEYYETPAVAVMVGDFPEEALCTIPCVSSSLESVTAACGPWYRRHEHHFGILHGDPRNPITPRLLEQLALEIPDVFFVGGLTSSSNEQFAQLADTLTEGGISGMLFDPTIRVTTGITQGCTPLGPRHLITGCELNIVHRIDDRPALDVLFEDIGEILSRNPRRIAGYIFAGLPILGGSSADYLVRNLIGLDLASRRIAIGERVKPGQALIFCRRDGNSAQNDLLRMLRDLRQRLPAPARGGVYYSCLGRGRHLFGEDSQEMRLIEKELGSIPLVGFFANGEFSRNRLYGYTGVLALFS